MNDGQWATHVSGNHKEMLGESAINAAPNTLENDAFYSIITQACSRKRWFGYIRTLREADMWQVDCRAHP